MIIGKFTRTGEDYEGVIETLALSRSVRLVYEPLRNNDSAPTHRLFAGDAEIGAAWPQRTNEGRAYLSVKLDDPSFTAPVSAMLFADDDVYSLYWTRPRRQNADR